MDGLIWYDPAVFAAWHALRKESAVYGSPSCMVSWITRQLPVLQHENILELKWMRALEHATRST
jgi:hypothetical protein